MLNVTSRMPSFFTSDAAWRISSGVAPASVLSLSSDVPLDCGEVVGEGDGRADGVAAGVVLGEGVKAGGRVGVAVAGASGWSISSAARRVADAALTKPALPRARGRSVTDADGL